MKKPEKISEKIRMATEAKSPVIARYEFSDESVQAELRLSAEWKIRVPVDKINFPRDLSGENGDLWRQMYLLDLDIHDNSRIISRRISHTIRINSRTKTGPAQREAAKTAWQIEIGEFFLAEYKEATKKSNLAKIWAKIIVLQAEQKALLPKLREKNSQHVAAQKTAREEQKIKNAEALKSGRFWVADRDTLKSYFHPPFDKNYLADVSERWRAALFLECESESYKRYSGDWGHKLTGTGRGYLCGIDDNGDEWEYIVRDIPQSYDEYGSAKLDSTVEDAMGELFGLPSKNLDNCLRQGDLLFCPATIRTEDGPEHCSVCGQPAEKHPLDDPNDPQSGRTCPWGGWYSPHIHKAPLLKTEEKWYPRESHEIISPSLKHNGTYFRADHEIWITHTSHNIIVLPAGEYRLYISRAAEPAD